MFLQSYFSLLFVFVALTLTGSATVMAAEEAQAEQSYVHSQQQCIRCHEDKTELQSVLTVSLGKCQSCHESAKPTSAPAQHQTATNKDNAQNVLARLDEPKRAVVPNRKENYGMRYPLYSDGSRLGDAPN